MKTLFKFMFLFTFALVLTSCDSDDDGTPEIVNEEEVITTVILNLDPGPTGTAITLRSFDSDGDGPTEPVITVSGELAANTIYEGEIQFLNETESPAEDITEEVREEDRVGHDSCGGTQDLREERPADPGLLHPFLFPVTAL